MFLIFLCLMIEVLNLHLCLYLELRILFIVGPMSRKKERVVATFTIDTWEWVTLTSLLIHNPSKNFRIKAWRY